MHRLKTLVTAFRSSRKLNNASPQGRLNPPLIVTTPLSTLLILPPPPPKPLPKPTQDHQGKVGRPGTPMDPRAAPLKGLLNAFEGLLKNF